MRLCRNKIKLFDCVVMRLHYLIQLSSILARTRTTRNVRSSRNGSALLNV